jgi:hypothetical protein
MTSGDQVSAQPCIQQLTEYLMPPPVYSILVFTTVNGQVAAAATARASPPVTNASPFVSFLFDCPSVANLA